MMTNDQQLQSIASALQSMIELDRKERAEHIGDLKAMNRAIDTLTESNIKLNESVNRLVTSQAQSQTQIETLRELTLSKHAELVTRQEQLANRVENLEKTHYINTGREMVSEKTSKFWSDNWHKILITITLIVNIAIYVVTK